jgi:hypothetical protein
MDVLTSENVLDQLAAELHVPVLTGRQAQGDIIVLPAAGQVPDATAPLPQQGVELVRGDGGHVHLLLGRVRWAPNPPGSQTIGTLTVPDGQIGYISHGDGTPASALDRQARHTLLAIGAGTYVVRRQRERAEQIRLVAD